jgi:membrane peptidoglycan carboxypeptidase
LMGNRQFDPWCQPNGAKTIRDEILQRMRANGVITQAELNAASAAPVALASRPEGRPPCRD